MKKPLKSIVLILVTAIIMFVVPVSADMIARPEIINPETDFSLNNPEAKKAVTVLAKSERCYGEITGPFNFYFVHENGDIELRFADYYAFRDDGKILLITLMQDYKGGYASQGLLIDKSDEEYIEGNHITISNESAMYIISVSGVKYAEPIPEDLRYSTPEKLQAINNVVSRSANYLLRESVSEITSFRLDEDVQLSSTETPSATLTGDAVPCIMMATTTKTTCYSACIASIVRHREPSFGNISDTDVYDVGKARFGEDFYKSTIVTIDQIYDVLTKDYLDKAGSHYSLAFSMSIKAMSQSSYKSIIDNGCVILGVFRVPANLEDMHAMVLCQYDTVDNDITAYAMEPANGEIRPYFWSNDRILCQFGNFIYYLYDHITSYY